MARTNLDKTDARQGVETKHVRWILGISLGLAGLLFIGVMAVW